MKNESVSSRIMKWMNSAIDGGRHPATIYLGRDELYELKSDHMARLLNVAKDGELYFYGIQVIEVARPSYFEITEYRAGRHYILRDYPAAAPICSP